MIAPCKDCPDRVLGCHSECAKYQEFNAWVSQKRASRMYADCMHAGLERKIRNKQKRQMGR